MPMPGGDWKEMFNAACSGDEDLVDYYLKSGVDADFVHPEFLSTPLVATILARQEKIALKLLDHGVDATRYSEFDGMTAMQAAQTMQLQPVVERLQQLGITPEPEKRRRRWWPWRWFSSVR